MAVIRRVKHWMLGEATVEPPVEVVNTMYKTWEPNADSAYPIQALHYAVMMPRVMKRDEDLRGDTLETSVGANNRSQLWTYGIADRVSRMNVVDAEGNPVGPLSADKADSPELSELGYRLDTSTLREEEVRFYQSVGGVTLEWIGEPPVIPVPLASEYFFPEGLPGQEQSI